MGTGDAVGDCPSRLEPTNVLANGRFTMPQCLSVTSVLRSANNTSIILFSFSLEPTAISVSRRPAIDIGVVVFQSQSPTFIIVSVTTSRLQHGTDCCLRRRDIQLTPEGIPVGSFR